MDVLNLILSVILTFGFLVIFILCSLFIFSLGYSSKQDSPYEEWKKSLEKHF